MLSEAGIIDTVMDQVPMANRSGYQVLKTRLGEQDDFADVEHLTASERIGMMWQLALNAWAFKDNLNAEPRLQRHLVVLKRREG